MIIIGNLETNDEITSSKLLRSHFDSTEINNKTYHKYVNELSDELKENIDIIKNGTIVTTFKNNLTTDYRKNYNVFPIDSMNEIYISCIGSGGSDKVFETPHIDGIFFLLPFCFVYRCVFAIQGDENIITSFPVKKINYGIKNNHFCAFDYNREIHNIYSENGAVSSGKKRILIKFHYIIAPQFLPYCVINLYKILNSRYNEFMRFLFLRSQGKQSYLGNVINKGTVFYTDLHIKFIFLFALLPRMFDL